MSECSTIRDGSALCMSCGLCCQDALHDRGALLEHEVEAAESLGLIVERKKDRLSFALPCARLSGSVCTIYDRRPSACRVYECGLLDRYLKAEVSLDQASQLIAEAKRRLADLQLTFRPGQTLRDARAEWRSAGAHKADRDCAPIEPASAAARLRLAAFMFFIDRHFMTEREAKNLEYE